MQHCTIHLTFIAFAKLHLDQSKPFHRHLFVCRCCLETAPNMLASYSHQMAIDELLMCFVVGHSHNQYAFSALFAQVHLCCCAMCVQCKVAVGNAIVQTQTPKRWSFIKLCFIWWQSSLALIAKSGLVLTSPNHHHLPTVNAISHQWQQHAFHTVCLFVPFP